MKTDCENCLGLTDVTFCHKTCWGDSRNFCRKCGKSIEPGQLVCPKCEADYEKENENENK